MEISCLDKFLRSLVMKVYDTAAVGRENEVKRDFFLFSIWKILEHVNSDGINPFIKTGLLIEKTDRNEGITEVFDKATRDGISRKDIPTIVTEEKKEKTDEEAGRCVDLVVKRGVRS